MKPGTIAEGAFDGVHTGHRAALAAAERPLLVLTRPPRAEEELLCTVERRLELLADAGADEVVVRPNGEPAAGEGGVAIVRDPDEEDPRTRASILASLAAGDMATAARLFGRPAEVEGVVVGGDARGRTLGFPTANLDVAPGLVVPAVGIYAGAAAGARAAISIGTNPTYGGRELRVEAFLLDFDGDLYGQRLVVELWERLRDEIAFPSEEALVEQIADDVERTRAAVRPDVSAA